MAKRYKKTEIIGEMDRLSRLPDKVLLLILSFLETKCVVRTSLLSRRWSKVWTSVPDLSFSSRVFFHDFHRFKNFVLHVLQRRGKSDIGRFLYSGSCDDSLFNKVVNYAISHNVHSLTLNLHYQNNFYLVPEAVLTCSSLNLLELTCLNLDDSLGSPSLRTLRLSCCTIRCSHHTASPFAGCPNLNKLDLHCCQFSEAKTVKVLGAEIVELSIRSSAQIYYDFSIEIAAPKLQRFCCSGFKAEDISLTFSPYLESCDIDIFEPTARGNDLLELLQNIKAAKFISLGRSLGQALSMDRDLLVGKPFSFRRLKSLTLRCDYSSSQWLATCICTGCRRPPSLTWDYS